MYLFIGCLWNSELYVIRPIEQSVARLLQFASYFVNLCLCQSLSAVCCCLAKY